MSVPGILVCSSFLISVCMFIGRKLCSYRVLSPSSLPVLSLPIQILIISGVIYIFLIILLFMTSLRDCPQDGRLLYNERYFARNNIEISVVPFALPIS